MINSMSYYILIERVAPHEQERKALKFRDLRKMYLHIFQLDVLSELKYFSL